jgi:hypothetical protein
MEDKTQLSANVLYCSLEDKLLEHGEDCPASCSFYHPCRALWDHVTDRADEITTIEYEQYQLTFDYFFSNMLTAKHETKAVTKNAWAVRLGRLGGMARAQALKPNERSKIAYKGAEARWGKRWVWD